MVKDFLKDSVIYGFGTLFAKGIGFLTVPLIARYFSQEDYGYLEMLILIVSLSSLLMTLGMDSAQSFYFFKRGKSRSHEGEVEVVSNVLAIRLMSAACLIILSFFLIPLLLRFILNDNVSVQALVLGVLVSIFQQLLSQATEIFRLLFKPWNYVISMFVHSVTSALLVLLLTIYLDKGIAGYMVGLAAASCLIMIIIWYNLRSYLSLSSIKRSVIIDLLRFGLPFLPAAMAMYIMTTADRWAIAYYLPANDLGIYALAAKVALICRAVVDVFRKAWWPYAMKAIQGVDGELFFEKMSILYVSCASIGAIVLSILSPSLIEFFGGGGYEGADFIVNILVWEAIFYGAFLIFGAGIWKSEKTWINACVMGASALVNVGLNFLFVPKFGLVGAASATLISSFLWITASLYISQRYWAVSYQYGLLALALCIGVVGSIIIPWATIGTEVSSVDTLMFLAFLCAVLSFFAYRGVK